MKKQTTDNVIQFPKENKRLDLSNIAVDKEEIFDQITNMKKSYFSDVADVMTDDVLRAIGILDLEETKYETFPVLAMDQILIKESIISTMCRIIGIEHPLHRISSKYIEQYPMEDPDEYYDHFSYRFREDPVPEVVESTSDQ